jgi:hypothetical protein
MFRQIMRTRFLIRKPGVERRAGHGFGVFPSGWHGQNNTRTFWIGKPLRTTSDAAGAKGISLLIGIVPYIVEVDNHLPLDRNGFV